MSFVYVAPMLTKQAFKIGKSRDPESRLLDLDKYYGFDFERVLIVDCGTEAEAYTLEKLLHLACDKGPAAFNYDGGTEFFDYKLYADLIVVLETTVKLKGYTLKMLASSRLTKRCARVAADDVDVLIQTVASAVRNSRLGRDITRVQLAEISGVSVGTLKRLETAKNVSLDVLLRVFKCLDLDYIFSELEVEAVTRRRAKNR